MPSPAVNTSEGAALYGDLGHWARHYSVVRMTLGTFWLGFPLLVLQQQWSTPDLVMFRVVIGMCLFGFSLYALFTAKAIQFSERQINQFKGLDKKDGALRGFGMSWIRVDGIYPGLVAYVLVAWVAWNWFDPARSEVVPVGEEIVRAMPSVSGSPDSAWKLDSLNWSESSGHADAIVSENVTAWRWAVRAMGKPFRIASAVSLTPREAPSAHRVPTVREVQVRLLELGHHPGPVDGILGPRTRQALRDFQNAQAIAATGEIDDTTVMKLGPGGTAQR